MGGTRKLIVLGVCLLVAAAGGTSLAAFSSQSSNSGNSFSAAASFGAQLRMASGTYDGNGNDNRSISGLGFQPDVVIVKAATNQIGVMRTSTMSGDVAKPLVGATALTANMIQSLTADGFTLGTNNTVNASGVTYYWTAFKAAADVLEVGSYTGNGTSQSLTGVGFEPEYVAVMATNNKDAVNRFSGMTNTFDFEDDKGVAGRITSLDALGFSVGSNDRTNGSGTVYHYLAINDVAGTIDAGTYTGNATNDRSITGVGFQPEYVMVRANDAATNRKQNHKFVTQADPNASFFRAETAYATGVKALESDGFKLGTDGSVNASGVTYHYLAFENTGGGCSEPSEGDILVANSDSWVNQASPTANNGSATTLRVTSQTGSQNQRAFVDFNMPTLPTGCTVTEADLWLNNTVPASGRTLEVHRAAAAWVENTITWNNQPATAGTASTAVTTGTAGYMNWDITTLTNDLYTSGDYGFRIADQNEDAASAATQVFGARESVSTPPAMVLSIGS